MFVATTVVFRFFLISIYEVMKKFWGGPGGFWGGAGPPGPPSSYANGIHKRNPQVPRLEGPELKRTTAASGDSVKATTASAQPTRTQVTDRSV